MMIQLTKWQQFVEIVSGGHSNMKIGHVTPLVLQQVCQLNHSYVIYIFISTFHRIFHGFHFFYSHKTYSITKMSTFFSEGVILNYQSNYKYAAVKHTSYLSVPPPHPYTLTLIRICKGLLNRVYILLVI